MKPIDAGYCAVLCSALCAVVIVTASCSGRVEGDEVASAAVPVIGGAAAPPGFAPWQVQIATTQYSQWCSGSLINSRWFVTAAHCVDGMQASAFTVTLGERDRTVAEGTEQVFHVLGWIEHKNFSFSTMANDIAVVQLDRDATFNQWVAPIALPSGRYDAPITAIIAGWGQTTQIDASTPYLPSNVLMDAALPIVDQATCASAMAGLLAVEPSMICAGYPDSVKGGCHGDSGGPLTVKNSNGVTELVGIVSWGDPYCRTYGVFTRVSDYVPWIKNIAFGFSRFACQGQTPAGYTNWQQYGSNAVYVDVDTSQCEYQAVPEYFTSLEASQGHNVTLGATSIYSPTAKSFRVYVNRSGITAAQANAWKWHLNWQAAPVDSTDPNLCTGRTTAGSTNWQAVDANTIFLDVDTSRCGRTTTPRYFTSLGGNSNHYTALGVTNLYSPTPTGFRLYLIKSAITPAQANQWNWYMNWAAAPSGNNVTSADQCAGSTTPGAGWGQSGTDTIYIDVDTTRCNRAEEPVYFMSINGGYVFGTYGVTSIYRGSPTGFRLYLTKRGLAPGNAQVNNWSIDWAAYP